MIRRTRNFMKSRLTAKTKYRIHAYLEKAFGYKIAYLTISKLSGSEYFPPLRKAKSDNYPFFTNSIGDSPQYVGSGPYLDLITLWPPQIGGPAEIAPFLRNSLSEYFSVRTLIPSSNHSFAYTGSVIPLGQANARPYKSKIILGICAYGEEYDEILKKLKNSSNQDVYVVWHDPCLEKTKIDFLKQDRKANLVKKYFVNSEAMATHLENYVNGSKIQILKTGAPSYQYFHEKNFPAKPLISFLGTFSDNKYCYDIFESFYALSIVRPDLEFVMAGHISQKDFMTFNERLKNSKVENFQILPYLSMKEWNRILTDSILSINLRKPPALESSGSLMDIIASGTPCIVTTDGSYKGIKSRGLFEAPLNISPSNISNIIEALLLKYLSDKNIWCEDSRELQKYANSHDLSNYTKEIFDYINSNEKVSSI